MSAPEVSVSAVCGRSTNARLRPYRDAAGVSVASFYRIGSLPGETILTAAPPRLRHPLAVR
ncbi:MAG TPA: hypothetical protein VNP97_10750 [Microbacterium sp.]|nr:hypothetical protein [Microbacterium sp.]